MQSCAACNSTNRYGCKDENGRRTCRSYIPKELYDEKKKNVLLMV